MTDKPLALPEVTRRGALDMQVCVPEGYDDYQVTAFAEAQNPCGTECGWAIRRQGDKELAGAKERTPCEQRAGYVHIMLDA